MEGDEKWLQILGVPGRLKGQKKEFPWEGICIQREGGKEEAVVLLPPKANTVF